METAPKPRPTADVNNPPSFKEAAYQAAFAASWDQSEYQVHRRRRSARQIAPMDDFTLRSRNLDGTYNETDFTADQARDLGAGKPISFTPRNERLVVNEDGTITYRDDARPQLRD